MLKTAAVCIQVLSCTLLPLTASMATPQANLNQHTSSWQTSMSEAESRNTVAFVADSWCSLERIPCDEFLLRRQTGCKRLLLKEHEVFFTKPNGDQVRQNYSIVDVYQFGGAKFSTVLGKEEWIEQWSKNVPRLTILHLGACDLANGPQGKFCSQPAFREYVKQFFIKWEKAAREIASRNGYAQKFEQQYREHMYLLIGMPDWGPFVKSNKPQHERSLDCEQYKKARKIANKGLSYGKNFYYKDFKAILFTPCTGGYKYQNNHLMPDDQVKYMKQIYEVASKLLCSKCRPSNDELIDGQLTLLFNGMCDRPNIE